MDKTTQAEEKKNTGCGKTTPKYVSIMLELRTLLDQFYQPKLDEWRLSQCENAKNCIKAHLVKFSDKTSGYTYNYYGMRINSICKAGSTRLLFSYPYWNYDKLLGEIEIEEIREHLKQEMAAVNKIDKGRIFQEKWLVNVPRLLPQEKPVMEILPYLLTCYTITAIENKLDPFDAEKKEFSSGWRDIFVDQVDNAADGTPNNCDPSDRSKSIESICNRFLLVRCRKFKKVKSPNHFSFKHKSVSFWEHYRRFAAFCLACADEEDVNITLSTALFSLLQPWCPSLGATSRNSTTFSEKEIQSDKYRKQILELFYGRSKKSICTGEFRNIHELVYYLNLDDIADGRVKDPLDRFDHLFNEDKEGDK